MLQGQSDLLQVCAVNNWGLFRNNYVRIKISAGFSRYLGSSVEQVIKAHS